LWDDPVRLPRQQRMNTRISPLPIRLHTAIALALMGAAFIASALISAATFERLPHLEDEFAYLYQAKIFAGRRVWLDRGNDPPKYFWQPFMLQEKAPDGDYQRQYSKYTPGWSLALALGVLVGQPWLINALLAALNVGLTYRLGREVFDPTVGVVGALLLAISPMALLLNASLMSHTWAMACTLLFVYGYWRTLPRNSPPSESPNARPFAIPVWLFAVMGGLAWGALAATRPLTAVAMALPVAAHMLFRLWALRGERTAQGALLRMGVFMALGALPTAALYPLYNYATTGDPRTNTYALLWSYDVIGFGEGIGLNKGGHSLYYGFRNARADLAAWFRDLYGVVMPPPAADYLRLTVGWGAGAGLSWLILGMGWWYGRKHEWVWFFTLFLIALIASGLLYWIGSVVNGAAAYSTRYYYEATFAVCLVSAYGVVTLARTLKIRPLWGRFPIHPVYLGLWAVCVASVVFYTPARLREPLPPDWMNGLWRYNKAGVDQIERLNAMRGDDPRPVTVIILRSPLPDVRDNWRDYAGLLGVSDPYPEHGAIIVVRVFDSEEVPAIVQRFSNRLVLYQIGERLYRTMEDALQGAAESGG